MIIPIPLILLVYLPLIAIDVLIFFAIIRLLRYKWTIPYFEAVDATGAPLVDWFASHTERILNRVSKKAFSRKTQLSIGITAMVLARVFLTALLSN